MLKIPISLGLEIAYPIRKTLFLKRIFVKIGLIGVPKWRPHFGRILFLFSSHFGSIFWAWERGKVDIPSVKRPRTSGGVFTGRRRKTVHVPQVGVR